MRPAIALTIGKRSPIAVFVIVVLTVAPVVASVLIVDHLVWEMLRIPFFVCIAFVSGCMIISFNGIFLLRNSPRSIPIRALAPAYGGYRGPSPLKMRDREVFRAEWRRTGWIIPCFAVATIVLGGTAQVALVPNLDALVVWFVQVVVLLAPPASCFIAGMLLLARDHRDSVAGVATYFWTRPASVQQVVLQRMRAVTYSAIATFLLPAALFVIGALLDSGLAAVRPIQDTFIVTFLYLGLLLLAWTFVWVPYVPILYLIISTTMKFNVIWGQADEFWPLLAPDVLFAFALAWVAFMCAKRKIFDVRIIVRFVAIGVVCCVILQFVIGIVYAPIDTLFDSNVAIYRTTAAVLSFMPPIALLSYGVFLDRLRHGALLRRLPSRR